MGTGEVGTCPRPRTWSHAKGEKEPLCDTAILLLSSFRLLQNFAVLIVSRCYYNKKCYETNQTCHGSLTDFLNCIHRAIIRKFFHRKKIVHKLLSPEALFLAALKPFGGWALPRLTDSLAGLRRLEPPGKAGGGKGEGMREVAGEEAKGGGKDGER